MNRLLIIGHDESEYQAIRERVPGPVVYFEMLPRLQLIRGGLHVEHPDAHGRFLPVSRVIFHGIFENDLPALAALALWGGPCYPRARGMMDCRLRIPCLVRALSATRFGAARPVRRSRDRLQFGVGNGRKMGRMALRREQSAVQRDLDRRGTDAVRAIYRG